MATAPKKRRTKKAARKGAPVSSDIVVNGVDADQGASVPVDPLLAGGGPIEVALPDGTIQISFPEPEPQKDVEFDANLAEHIDDFQLGRIAETLLEAIEEDERNRSEWIQQRADGLDLLGWKIERPGGGNVGTSSTAVPGQSTVRDGILGEACDRFQANAFAELCPAEGPCKVVDYGSETTKTDGLANEFEKDMNFYLTGGGGPGTATEYYPDTREMLFWTGYASGMFKKVYKCPLRNRPVSERVDGADLIIPSNATDLHNAGRITHQINMRQSVMKRMQLLGNYRKVDLTAPTPQPNVLTTKQANVVGMNPNPQREPDQDYTIYECYCELDIEGFEHQQKGDDGKLEPTGLPLPYKVTMDKDSRIILEIRRNWNPPKPAENSPDEEDAEGDPLPVAKIPFVLFPYATGLGIYGTGLLHRLGNYAMALTAMLRECIDAGMFASFPGFLFAKPMGRQLQNEFRVPPGGGAPIDVSACGNNINNAVMPLPYKDVSTAMVALMQQTRETAARYGGTAESPTGEGVVNAPVGSVLAAIDQATRIEGGVHKALYAAQREELGLFKELFRDDPEALFRGNKRPALGADQAKRIARFKLALENCDLVPASDPNVPSHMHRLAKANSYLQMALGMPGVFDMQKVSKRWATAVKIDDVDQDFAPPQQAPPPDPLLAQKMAIEQGKLQLAQGKVQIDAQKAIAQLSGKLPDGQQTLDAQKLALQAQQGHAQLQSKEQIEAAKIAQSHVTAMADGGPVEPPPPDPNQERALDLKAQQIEDNRAKMHLDAHVKHADRQSKETIEAFKLAQAVVVHPESQEAGNAELAAVSDFMTPATGGSATPSGPGLGHNGGPPMADGGPVGTLLDEEAARSIKLGLEIARALQERRSSEYMMQ